MAERPSKPVENGEPEVEKAPTVPAATTPTVRVNLVKMMTDNGPGRVDEIDGEIGTRVEEILKLATERAKIEVALRLLGGKP